MTAQPLLGTLLRHLVDILDGDVQAQYAAQELPYRPRYTPVVKALLQLGEGAIRTIATHAGMTHSAVSQTVVQMIKDGLVCQVPSQDRRERVVQATPVLTAMIPRLQGLWAATDRAAADLEAELPYPLVSLLFETVAALEARPFRNRIVEAGNLA